MEKQKHHVQKPYRVFFLIELNVKNQKAIAFKLKVFFYRLSIARWVF